MHLALDVHGVQLPVVVLGDDLHYILLLKGIFIHPLHGAHAANRDRGAHLQQLGHKPAHQLIQVCRPLMMHCAFFTLGCVHGGLS